MIYEEIECKINHESNQVARFMLPTLDVGPWFSHLKILEKTSMLSGNYKDQAESSRIMKYK